MSVVVFKKEKSPRRRGMFPVRSEDITNGVCSARRWRGSRQITVRQKHLTCWMTILGFCQQHVREYNLQVETSFDWQPQRRIERQQSRTKVVERTTKPAWRSGARAWGAFGHAKTRIRLGAKRDAEPRAGASRRTPPPPHRTSRAGTSSRQDTWSKPEVRRRISGSSGYSTPI